MWFLYKEFDVVPYIAPEEFEGLEYDAREVDIWATGVIYYTMMYSALPWYVLLMKDARC
jgi:serine/threonine protein kinase